MIPRRPFQNEFVFLRVRVSVSRVVFVLFVFVCGFWERSAVAGLHEFISEHFLRSPPSFFPVALLRGPPASSPPADAVSGRGRRNPSTRGHRNRQPLPG